MSWGGEAMGKTFVIHKLNILQGDHVINHNITTWKLKGCTLDF